jgi:hypothetical protein
VPREADCERKGEEKERRGEERNKEEEEGEMTD